MARTAQTRTASLSPDEARLADCLADRISKGSFTELTRYLLMSYGAPVNRWLEELENAGIDPREALVMMRPRAAATDEEIEAFYAPSSWPKAGPQNPSRS